MKTANQNVARAPTVCPCCGLDLSGAQQTARDHSGFSGSFRPPIEEILTSVRGLSAQISTLSAAEALATLIAGGTFLTAGFLLVAQNMWKVGVFAICFGVVFLIQGVRWNGHAGL